MAKDEIRNLNVFNTNIFDMKEELEQYLKETMVNDCTFYFEHVKVLIDFNTTFGFEIVAN